MHSGYKAEGVILKRTNFGEADRTLTLFTKHLGKVRLLAKGIRKTTSRKGGNLELFNLVKVAVSRGRNLDIVTEVEVIKSFQDWRKDLKKVALAYHYCELVDRLTIEENPHPSIFELLTEALDKLHLDPIDGENFAQNLVWETGFWPKGKPVKAISINDFVEQVSERRLVSGRIFEKMLS